MARRRVGRLYRLLLRLYPGEFRERFGREMAGAFEDGLADSTRPGDRVRFWRGIAGDFAVHAPGVHMDLLRHDLRYAARSLRRSPVFALVAVATLALGIGATAAIFSVVHAVALRPLAFRDPSRVVRIWEKNDRLEIPRFATSVPNYVSWREQATVFEGIAAWHFNSATITTGGDPERLTMLEVSANTLPVLGLSPIAGRNFSEAEDRPGGAPVAILFESVWRNRFGADPAIVGRTIVLDGVSRTVIGVIRDAHFVLTAQVLVPLARDVAREHRGDHRLSTVGRLKPGVSLEKAQQELNVIAGRLAQQFPDSNRDWGVTMATAYDWIVPPDTRRGLYLLLASVIVVLLIACSNVASLMLARAALRRRELALRVALGASRFRIVRGVLAESLLLAAAGGGGGLLLAWWLLPILQAQLTGDLLPRAEAIGLDNAVLWFSAAVTLTCGLLFGVIPATTSSRRDVARTLEQGSRGNAAPQQGRARQALVVGQMALAVMLLAGAGLLAQSLRYLHRVDLGFEPEGLTTAMIGLPEQRYDTAGAHQFYDRLLAGLSASAGVEGAAIASGAPMTGSFTSMQVRAVGSSALPDTDVQADWRVVSGGYFDTMRLPLVRGRSFDLRDAREDAPKVIVLSADLARRLWPDRDPIGREVRIGNGNIHRVVGIVSPARILTLGLDPRPAMYFPAAQFLWDPMVVVVRGAAGSNLAPVLRRAVADLDPQLALFSGGTMEELIARDAAQPRLTAWMVGVFAGLALLLAAIGLYGVIAFLVAQRTQEIGVRMALGARPSSVLRLVLGRSARLAAVGIGLGLLAALAAGPVLNSLLFGVRSRDPLTLATAGIVLFLLALTASYLPARRATRVDPVVALRAE